MGVYVEPFVGGGSVFFASGKPYAPTEIIADADGDITSMYTDIQAISNETFRAFGFTPSSCRFSQLRSQTNCRDINLEERLFRNLYLSLYSYGGNRVDYCGDKSCNKVGDYRTLKANHEKYKDRLKGVTVLTDDCLNVITKYDSKHAFFYCDPPYNKDGRKNYKKTIDVNELFLVLSSIQGKFMVSFLHDEFVDEICARYGFFCRPIPSTYSGKTRSIDIVECVITNYDTTS